MLARVPWTAPLRAAPKPKPRRINKDRRKHLVGIVATILARGEPTKFAHEAYCRHSLRSGLCLKGWTWAEADTIATEIVKAALNRVGAQRPSWKEGQPWFTESGVTAIERSHCIRCHGPLPEGHRRFCSSVCGSAFRADMARQDDRAAYRATVYAYYAEWSARQSLQPCPQCQTLFRPKRPGQRFCSVPCRNVRNGGLSLRRRA